MTWSLRKVRNEELQNVYFLSIIVRMVERRIRKSECLAHTDEMINTYNILIGKSKDKRLVLRGIDDQQAIKYVSER